MHPKQQMRGAITTLQYEMYFSHRLGPLSAFARWYSVRYVTHLSCGGNPVTLDQLAFGRGEPLSVRLKKEGGMLQTSVLK